MARCAYTNVDFARIFILTTDGAIFSSPKSKLEQTGNNMPMGASSTIQAHDKNDTIMNMTNRQPPFLRHRPGKGSQPKYAIPGDQYPERGRKSVPGGTVPRMGYQKSSNSRLLDIKLTKRH